MSRISSYYAVGFILLLLSLTAMPALGETGKTLFVGGDNDFPPYEFLKNGEPTGFNIDLIRAVAETMGLDIEIRLSEWSLTKQNLKDGSIDIIAGMVYSDERGKLFAFSLPHTMISPVLFVRNESAFYAYDDISGKEIIVEEDDIMHDFLKSQAFASRIIAVSSLTDALRLLSAGKHDAALISSEIYKYYITSKLGFSNLREIKTNLPSQNYCFAVAKENRALLHTLDRGLIRLKSTGKYQQIYNKWFGIYEQKRWWDSFKYILFVLLLAITFIIISLFWSWTLKKTVQAQTAELRENEKELQTAQVKLEKRVEERTADLAFANTKLNDEIRERQKIEEALRDSEAKYRAIVEAFDGQIYICSPDFHIEYMNQRLIERTGYDATGERCYKVLHGRDSICPWCINEKILQGQTVRWEMQSPKDNRWYYIVNTPIYHSQGKVSKQAMILDITDRVEAEKEKQKLEEKNRQLQKIKSLDRMAGAIAHHFNNKLHVVKGQMDLALQAISNKNKTTQHIKNALQEADKAADVSRLMLTYLGKANHPKDTVDLSEVCRRSINQIQTDMPNHIKLDLALPTTGPAIIGNANQIQLLLSNIIRNSWEAIGKDKGTIQLHVKIVSARDISSAQRFPIDWQPQEKEYGCLVVKDSGCGIETKDIEAAFDPFFSTKFTGRGLGLSVVLGLIQTHNGAITVESTLGKGSIFNIYLPISTDKIATQPETETPAKKYESGGTVLLVDDDKTVLILTRELLTMLGFDVLTAMDGSEAVEIFEQHKDSIRFVLSDFAMPKMNGLEMLNKLRQMEPNIPAIMASGYSEEQVMDANQAEKPQTFMEKPYGIEELKEAIALALSNPPHSTTPI